MLLPGSSDILKLSSTGQMVAGHLNSLIEKQPFENAPPTARFALRSLAVTLGPDLTFAMLLDRAASFAQVRMRAVR